MKKVIIDTNFWMIPGSFHIDILREIKKIATFTYKLAIIDKTIDELNKIISDKNSKTKYRDYAKIGLGLIEKNDIIRIKSKDFDVDSAIIRVSDKDTVVATSDKELKKELKKKNIQLIIIRKKQYLMLE